MKSPGLRKQAIDEIASEKARIFQKRHRGKSSLEKHAGAAKRAFEYQKSIRLKQSAAGSTMDNTSPVTAMDSTPALDFREVSPEEFPKEMPLDSVLDLWMPPKKKKEKEEEAKPRTINTATVVAIRKKMMAMEWRRARGITRPDPRMILFEKEASQWQEKRDARKRQAAEEKRKTEALRSQLEACLAVFGRRLLDAKGNATPDMVIQFFEEALEPLGEVADLEWEKNGCRAIMEPWEEKKRRRKEHLLDPVYYELRIDKEFNISSYEKIKDEKKQRAEHTKHFLKPLMGVIREKFPRTGIEVLEEALSETGRIVSLNQDTDGWSATIEPWAEMRSRNVRRGGRPPIVAYDMKFDTELKILWSRKEMR
jgi:hypothetical protein